MNKISCILTILLLSSCNYFDVKKTSSEEILNDELKSFNWKEVDEYPSFSTCDSSATKLQRKLCFEQTLTSFITSSLQNEQIIVSQDINDTLIVNFKISETGTLKILDVKIDTITEQEIPDLKNLLIKSLDSVPQILPGIKRGQHVTTEFKLPIIIKMN